MSWMGHRRRGMPSRRSNKRFINGHGRERCRQAMPSERRERREDKEGDRISDMKRYYTRLEEASSQLPVSERTLEAHIIVTSLFNIP